MGFMDKIKEAAQDVATEAKKATAQGKTKIDQLQTRKKADDAARRLGYLIHAERTTGSVAGAEAERLVLEITQLEEEIAVAQSSGPQVSAAPEGSMDAAGHTAPKPPPDGPAATPPPAPSPPPSSDPTPGDFKL
jgi:hypothetical protein